MKALARLFVIGGLRERRRQGHKKGGHIAALKPEGAAAIIWDRNYDGRKCLWPIVR